MMEPQSFHPLDYLSVANRRKWWFIVPLVLCIAAGAGREVSAGRGLAEGT